MEAFERPQPLLDLEPVLRDDESVGGRVYRVQGQAPHDGIPTLTNLGPNSQTILRKLSYDFVTLKGPYFRDI